MKRDRIVLSAIGKGNLKLTAVITGCRGRTEKLDRAVLQRRVDAGRKAAADKLKAGGSDPFVQWNRIVQRRAEITGDLRQIHGKNTDGQKCCKQTENQQERQQALSGKFHSIYLLLKRLTDIMSPWVSS